MSQLGSIPKPKEMIGNMADPFGAATGMSPFTMMGMDDPAAQLRGDNKEAKPKPTADEVATRKAERRDRISRAQALKSVSAGEGLLR